MRDLAILFIHLIANIANLISPGGARAVIAESLLFKYQLIILNRGRERALKLGPLDRNIAGLSTLFIRPGRLIRAAVVLKPSTLLAFHATLVKRKYRQLFSPKRRGKPGPKRPSPDLVTAIVETKQRNPSWGCRRIAQQLSLIFGVEIYKDIVRRVLAKHFRPGPGAHGRSWLTLLAHSKNRLWSVDLLRCESLILKNHWVLVVMDQLSRPIIGFDIHAGAVDGPALCGMVNQANHGARTPKFASTDHDPLFRFHRWTANIRNLEVEEIKTVPYVPLSHPFVERLIGTIRREHLDRVPFWNARDLGRKLNSFRDFYNNHRCHHSLGGVSPGSRAEMTRSMFVGLHSYRWQSHCNGLYELPAAA